MTLADFTLEQELLAGGARCVVFCDEVGRGALAGPVAVAAAAITDATSAEHPPVADPKAVPAACRAALAAAAAEWVEGVAVGWSSAATIDRAGISAAVAAATIDALAELLGTGLRPQVIYSDGTTSFVRRQQLRDAAERAHLTRADWNPDTIELRHQVRLDATSAGCAAASLVAKVARDAHMSALAVTHPNWGFDRHAGYGTDEHTAAISAHGLSGEHRATFCRRLIDDGTEQLALL